MKKLFYIFALALGASSSISAAVSDLVKAKDEISKFCQAEQLNCSKGLSWCAWHPWSCATTVIGVTRNDMLQAAADQWCRRNKVNCVRVQKWCVDNPSDCTKKTDAALDVCTKTPDKCDKYVADTINALVLQLH